MKEQSQSGRWRAAARDGAHPPVIYPGSFDPVTNGHLDIIRRAARLFSRLIVAVVANPQKTPMFGLDARVAMLRESCRDLPNVEIEKFEGLLVDFVRSRGAVLVVKGLRIVSDFEHEYSMAILNRKIKGGIDTVFLPASLEYTYLSSSSVREVYSLGGDIAEFVPGPVLKRMRRAEVRPLTERKRK
jgi:pantetheine-phosphate adenylyltransferase